jgi:triacylglycerol lipase
VRGLHGAAFETAWVAAHVATYPLGLVGRMSESRRQRYGLAHLPPAQRGLLVRDVEAAGTPILLVHGLIDNRSIFTVLRRGLLRRGFGHVRTINYSPLTDDVRAAAVDLAGEVEALVAESGYERVHVIGHSMGGLIARYYVQRLGGHERVHTLVTLGTPHAGTLAAHLLPMALCRQLRPGSTLVRELAEPAPGISTRFVAYWSDLDQLMVPRASVLLVHPDLRARSEAVHGVGHMALPISPRVVREISDLLAVLDPDGGTRRPGVSTLAR